MWLKTTRCGVGLAVGIAAHLASSPSLSRTSIRSLSPAKHRVLSEDAV
jgi:hypothetical protein